MGLSVFYLLFLGRIFRTTRNYLPKLLIRFGSSNAGDRRSFTFSFYLHRDIIFLKRKNIFHAFKKVSLEETEGFKPEKLNHKNLPKHIFS